MYADSSPRGMSRVVTALLLLVALVGVSALVSSVMGIDAPPPAALQQVVGGGHSHQHKHPAAPRPHEETEEEEVPEEVKTAPVAGAPAKQQRVPEAVYVRVCPACPEVRVEEQECVCEAPAECPVCESAKECPAPPPCPVVQAAPAAPAGSDASAEDGYAESRRHLGEGVSYGSLAEAVAAHTHPRTRIVTFTQGNAGFHELTRNWVAMLKVIKPPMPYFVVALDAQELENVKRLPAPVFFDPARAFNPQASNYREGGYNQMTMNKWGVALDVIKLGSHAFMVDPDIAMLRNPLPYFETLPECDYMTMMEGNPPPLTADEVVRSGGYYTKAYEIHYDNLMNTGYSLFRSSPRMISVVDEFIRYLGEPAQNHQPVEDQTHWANFIQQRFHIRGTSHSSPADVRGRAVVDAIVGGRCIEYVRDSDTTDATAFTFLPLNPFLFLNRPSYHDHKLHLRIMERPFAVHYNYVVGTGGKKDGLVRDGFYWA